MWYDTLISYHKNSPQLGTWGGKFNHLVCPFIVLNDYAFLTASLCLSANWIIFLKYIRKASDRHLRRNFISSILMSCEWRRTHAPTLTECDVNLVNSSFFVILYTFLAASCRIELIWISSIWHVFFLFLLVSVYTAMGLSFGILSFFALFLILLLALTKQCFLFCYLQCMI